jgi:hypothetical protein
MIGESLGSDGHDDAYALTYVRTYLQRPYYLLRSLDL